MNSKYKMRNLVDFPPEMLVAVFSELDYLTLHLTVRPTCTVFNNIITTATAGPLAKKLFVAKEASVTPKPKEEPTPPAPPLPETTGTGQINGYDLSLNENNDAIQVSVPPPKDDTIIAKPEKYCFEFHPCLHKLKIDYTAPKRDEQLSVANIGFFHTVTNTFTSIIDMPHLYKQNALSFSIPAAAYIPTHSNSANPTPFVLSTGPRNENLTVEEYIQTYIANIQRWSTVNPGKGVRTLFHPYVMDEKKRKEMPREQAGEKWVLRYWDDVFYDGERKKGRHRYRDTKIVCAVQEEREWKKQEEEKKEEGEEEREDRGEGEGEATGAEQEGSG